MHDDSDADAYQRKVQKIRESYEERKAAATGEKRRVVYQRALALSQNYKGQEAKGDPEDDGRER